MICSETSWFCSAYGTSRWRCSLGNWKRMEDLERACTCRVGNTVRYGDRGKSSGHQGKLRKSQILGQLLLKLSLTHLPSPFETCHEPATTLICVYIFLEFHCIFFKINLFYLFLAVLGLHCCMRAFSSCGGQGYSSLRCVGFSLRWLLLLRSTSSRCAGFSSCGLRALDRRLSSCGALA